MFLQLSIVLYGLVKGPLELDFARWHCFFRSSRLIVSRESIMGELEDPSLSDNTVDCVAIRTTLRFSTLLVYSLANLSPPEVINVRSSQLP